MINVGIIGLGVVGSGTTKLLLENKDILQQRLGFEINLKRIAVRNIKSKRGVKVPGKMLTTDVDTILDDPDIHIVAELIGGISPARDFILKAIQRGKHVVTANKALLATEGATIFNSASRAGIEVGFEASVAGAIPIIKAIKESLIANKIKSLYGIINGTSNFILTKMTEQRVEFSDALKEAQSLGYAEADPTLDIEGIDTAHKLTILSTLAYSIPLSFNAIYIEGISNISTQDIEFALELGYKVKLLAIAKETDGEVELRVHPTMIPKDYLIAKVDGPFNAIYVDGDATGATLYYGRGAGSAPTGSAVVSDITDIARNIQKDAVGRVPIIPKISRNTKIRKIQDIVSRYYLRFSALDKPGVLSKISGVLGSQNISIKSVIQKDHRTGEAVPLVLLTHDAKELNMRKAIRKIDRLPVVMGKTVVIRVEGERRVND